MEHGIRKPMDTPQLQFQAIAEKLAAESQAITVGKMMSSPGIRYDNKVFAFFYKEGMVFRFGRGFDPATMGIHDYQLLSPFKTRPPLLDWFEISSAYMQQWEALARVALQRMIEQRR
jgi:hypothetical protein